MWRLGRSVLVAAVLAWPAFGLEAGEEVADLKLRDGKSKSEVSLPDFGKKVVTIFYTDADVADMNDPLADAMRAKKFDLDRHRSFGVVNLEESKAPNFIIEAVVKGKVEKYQTTILVDPNRHLPRSWGLTETNNTSVIIVIGVDRKVRYLHRGPVRGAELEAALRAIEDAMAAVPPASETP